MYLGERAHRRRVIQISLALSLAMTGLFQVGESMADTMDFRPQGWQTPIANQLAQISTFDFFQEWYSNMIGIKGNQINASNVQISVLDTGFTPTGKSLTSNNNVLAARDYSNSGNTLDGYGHGTNACSILATSGAEIISRKVFNDQGGVNSLSEIANAISDSSDSDILVLNFASNTPEIKELTSSIRDVTESGVIVFCPAGNAGRPSPDAPASLGAIQPAVISTSSIYYDGKPSWFTNHSGTIYNAIYTPGEFVHSINNKGEVTYFNGTSASAPLAAIAMSILLSVAKKEFPNESKIEISQRSRELFLANSQIVPGHERSAGIPNISKAMQSLRLLLAKNAFVPLITVP